MTTLDIAAIEVRAAVARESGALLQIETLRLRDLKPHEVLVRNKAAGLCHTRSPS